MRTFHLLIAFTLSVFPLMVNCQEAQLVVWLMNGNEIGQVGMPISSPSADTEFIGTGDFNSDNKADIVFYNSTSDEVDIWLMDGMTRTQIVSPPQSDPSLSLVGVGKFNDDDKADLLWYNATTNEIVIWIMDGILVTAEGQPVNAITGSGWTVFDVADFNNDNLDDILWYQEGPNQFAIWEMTGTAPSQTNIPVQGPDDFFDRLTSVGDYDGDGRADLYWFNYLSYVSEVWILDGTNPPSTNMQNISSGVFFPDRAGDFNGDTMEDVFWVDEIDDRSIATLMEGLNTLTNTHPVLQAPDHSNIYSIIIDDFDSDGKADVGWYVLGPTITSIEQPDQNEISVYPNPVSGMLYLEGVADTEVNEIDIYDNLNRLVASGKPVNNSLDLSHLNAGCYFLVLKRNDKREVFKILISK